MPSIVSTSEQLKMLTHSTDGTNMVPKLRAKSHLFLEGGSFTQTQSQVFGPVSTQQFRTTAKLSVTGTKKVYAICAGQIFVQPQTGNSNKVNLILRPFRQPIKSLPIKFFIYRGFEKSDFINTGDFTLAPKSTSGMMDLLRSGYENFYADDTDGAPAFSAGFIGFPENIATQPADDLILKYFFKISKVIDETTGEEDPATAYELPLIPRGTHLGTVSGEIGLDMILDYGTYYREYNQEPFRLDLAFARAPEGLLDNICPSANAISSSGNCRVNT
jgi:hypothetical protein